MKYGLTIFFALWVSTLVAQQPNFVLLLSDDQAWNGLSCEMHPDYPGSKSNVIETPNITRLAAQGMRFSSAYSPASVCSPTRISLQTGKSPAQCRWTKAAPSNKAADGFKLLDPVSRKNISADETTIAEVLKTAGYTTAHYGKWHLGGGGPEVHGYDASDGDTGNEDAAPHIEPNPVDILGMGARAAAFMEISKQKRMPFFIQMSYHALHYPENASRALIAKYTVKMSGGSEKEIGCAAISEDLDRGVGLLLQKIDQLGLGNNTYVIYMSDNGASTRKLLRGGKGGVWEGGIRVPLIICGPGIAANSWCHERVVGYDLFNTFCELAGVKQPLTKVIEGGSITHLLRGESTPVQRSRPELVFHFPHYQGDAPHTALFLENYKLLRFYEDGEIHLFDIRKDIGETENLATSLPDRVKEMTELMDAYLADVKADLPKANPQYDPAKDPGDTKMKKGKGGRKKEKNIDETPKEPVMPASPGAGTMPGIAANVAAEERPERIDPSTFF